MKKKAVTEESDEFEVDEPEEFDESGSDWAPEEDGNPKKRKARPKSASKKGSPNKKKKVDKKAEPEDDDDDEEEEDEEEEEDDEEDENEEGEDSEESDSEVVGNGSFVVLKSDLKDGSNPPIWKIDGKALLQKYIPFQQDGKQLYKSTSTYSGWTQHNKDQYAAAPINVITEGKKETIIEFLRDQVNLDEKKEEGGEEVKA